MARKRRNFFNRKASTVMQRKLIVLILLVAGVFACLAGYIMWEAGRYKDEYTRKVLDQQEYGGRVIPFKRGDILDRGGTVLATSEKVYNVALDIVEAKKTEKSLEETLSVLEECFGISRQEVKTLMEENPKLRYTILKKGVDYATAETFEKKKENGEHSLNLQGVWLEENYARTYPYNTLASDVIGFVSDGNQGSTGLEASYNGILNGTDGREYGYQGKDETLQRSVKEAENGSTLVTTIDLQVQSIVEKHILAFNEAHKNEATEGEGSKTTAVLVMNPQNGEILAEASYPNYDLNHPSDLSRYYSEEKQKEMSDEEKNKVLNELWNNFCVSATYEPGSTFKPFTMAAALETGVLSGEETLYCGSMLHVGDHDIYCYDKTAHGTQTLKQVMENSCNVGLMQIGAAMGAEAFCKYQKLFGFGEYTGVDLPGEGETEGLLYTPENMDPASLATNAFGQNFNVTMTQMAASFSALINGGDYYKPHLVKQIQDEQGNVTENKEPVIAKKIISKETCEVIKDQLLGVVEEGTGKSAKVEGYDIGGKTGTAEKLPRNNGKYLVSFIGYVPQEKPEVVIYVVIDEPNVGNQAVSSYATRLSADIMAEILPYLGVEKVAETQGQAADANGSATQTGSTQP